MNQEIMCNVANCKYNKSSECSKKQIEVGNTVQNPSCTKETECNSFEC